MCLVSVVVPVYRAEQFLNNCVDSIIRQTYTDLEILLVDDGSDDRCPEICDEYAKKDSRIKVIHKKNGGVSSARNAGIDAAAGKYLCFVDSDDVVEINGVEKLVEATVSAQSQYTAGICGIMGSEKVKNPIENSSVIDFFSQPEELLQYLIQPGSYSPYAKLFDLDIIKENNIRYDTALKCSEDALFVRSYLKHCRKMALCSEKVYLYNTGNGASLSKRGYADYSLYFEKKLYALKELLEVLPLSDDVKKSFLASRAVAGLKNSINHYCLYNFPEGREALVSSGLQNLVPWFAGYPPEKLVYMNRAVKSWCEKYYEHITDDDLSRAAAFMVKSERKNSFNYQMKSRIKYIISKIVRR